MTEKKTTKKTSDRSRRSPVARAEASLAFNAEAISSAEPKKRRVNPKGKNAPGRTNQFFDERRQEIYLNALLEHGEPDLARLEVGVSYETIRQHRKKTEGFAEREEDVMRIYRARISQAIHRRGIDGIQEPIYWQGFVVGWITKYSDRLLELHAKRHIPEYREKVTVDNKHSGSISLLSDLSALPPELREKIRQVLKDVKDFEEAESSE